MRGWAARRSLALLLLLGISGAAAVSTGGYYAYRTWDYIEHDNDFCMSCHLMQGPFELFEQSSHQGLSCKACHTPNLMERSQMAMAQVVENPDSISAHAEVTNDKCATCHIDGDPDEWSQIANSAGHRVHLESDDPALDGLMCVECHSASLHRFTATQETCAQSGCHTDVTIQLAGMEDLTVHCAACHGFNREVSEGAEFAAAVASLAPDEGTCLGCHEMQTRVEMPADEPHGAVCATCHNPHSQPTPEAAVESCATSGCHAQPDTLTAFHRGLSQDQLQDCSGCHGAHEFRLDGADCASCHQDQGSILPGLAGSRTEGSVVHRAGRPAGEVFDHRDHPGLDCASCHSSDEEHGALTVETTADCRSCHHAPDPAADCATCHSGTALASSADQVQWAMDFTVRPAVVRRPVDFEHAVHETADCVTCHAPTPDRPLIVDSCASCHLEHHEQATDCLSCHVEAPLQAHPVEQVHRSCSGAGCHTEVAASLQPRLRERATCLSCHQDQAVDHHDPGTGCASCHLLPPLQRADPQ